jgi:ribonuclease BN (tRNA processing enzyme)
LEVRILGAHAHEFRGTRLPSLLVDGILAVDAGGLTSALSFSEQQRIKAILLTHHHFDHTRDLVTFGFNAALWQGQIEVHALQESLDILIPLLLDGKMYANLLEYPSQEKPSLQFKTIEPYGKEDIAGYEVSALPVKHTVPTLGYQVMSPDGKRIFYTGDSGPGLSHCWQYVSPDLLFCESSAPNKLTDFAKSVGHLSPELLKGELIQFKQLKGYLPRVIVIHISLAYEDQIGEEVAQVADELGADIRLGCEDMKIVL